ncbi:MAG: FAD-binding molybdopterin dehydrogenase [Friedmanniella sp.]|nr:FAD-binding molybdopterin dehydrogenase [Friedmanniella sp.]
MDLHTVTDVRAARTRADLAGVGGSTAVLAGGSWLFSEPQHHLVRLVDLGTLGWPEVEHRTDGSLSLAATCTLRTVSALSQHPAGWPCAPLFHQTCTALVGSFKVWNVATVGGNIATSLPAGPMTSLAAALDADAVLWHADGTDSRIPVADLVTGDRTNRLGPGDVLRSVDFPADTLSSRTAYRKIALSPLGRSGSLVIGRRGGDGFVLTVTAATTHPVQLRYPGVPEAAELAADVDRIDAWWTDPNGAADWRHAVSRLLAEEIRVELAAPVRGTR